jgi:flagellar hook-basal body complex protein FliE
MNPISAAYNPQVFTQYKSLPPEQELAAVGEALSDPFKNVAGVPVADFQSAFSGESSGIKSSGALSNSVGDFIRDVDTMSKRAESARASLLSGESNNLHQAMLASQEAGVSFSLMVEMRNKVLETYQELMRLQV